MATRILSALVAAGLIGSAVASPPPLPHSAGPPGFRSAPAPPRNVSAWLPYWDQKAAYRDALRHAAQLHTVSPFWYQAVSAGQVDGHPGAGERGVIDGLRAAGISVVPTVMETMKPGALGEILTSPTSRATHIRTLIGITKSRPYDGLDIDYETIAATGDASYEQVRAGYAAFVTDLCRALHDARKKCVITVSPQTGNTGRIWDYAAIGRAADRVRIMAYDLHWRGGQPGPLSTPSWYDEILRNATALIPRTKIEMALPAYGWDWVPGGETKHVTWKEAEALRVKKGAPYRLDAESGSPTFTYQEGEQTRTVWYQDARGVAAHLPTVRKYNIAGTGLWALNFEDPGLWPVLADG
ncbi:glycosyl hydrolase [Streptomyces sp. ISL-96]|uniref:glycosyl hydrolase family 18 protein n=1 Tax=Streptomyces sp. ISL-96 TaxID=2819191 RepID=UPI001BE82AFB|nr:glycosyl hydrolase family 18 protein [Streptomyces sp. ISL-96]MBT2489946.1 glycosyl hydrolase [Streptomyces sp. ISL-96]